MKDERSEQLVKIGEKLDALRALVAKKEAVAHSMRQDLMVLEALYDHACRLEAMHAAKKIIDSLDEQKQ